ncbi:MAG: response regulator transcription factor [Haliea sp.]|nr:MAG: response regulator transcription factor [Haliea sp.]
MRWRWSASHVEHADRDPLPLPLRCRGMYPQPTAQQQRAGVRPRCRPPDGRCGTAFRCATGDLLMGRRLPEAAMAATVCPRTVRVGIADDHLVVQQGLRFLLAQQPRFEVAALAQTGDEALQMVTRCPLDLLILDIGMPGLSALDVLGEICKRHPALKVVIYSGYPACRYAALMSRLGASAYIEKGMALEDVMDAIDAVLGDRLDVSAETPDPLAADAHREEASLPALTPREFQVFIRLASGEAVGQIARALGVSVVTVSTHRAAVLRKFGLASNPDLTKFALAHDYVK